LIAEKGIIGVTLMSVKLTIRGEQSMKYRTLLVLFLLGIAIALTACSTSEPPECPDCPQVECPEAPPCPDCPEPEACPEYEAVLPTIEVAWSGSGHADIEAEAFRYWDEDDPVVISTSCAKCHSTDGYIDFLGADGSEVGSVETEYPALENMGIECVACHNSVTASKDSVLMPTGIELSGLGGESRCMECHQGRHSKVSVDASIAEAAGVENAVDAEEDIVYEELGFANIHYYPAAATKYGTLTLGGYQYEGKSYDGNFAHVDEFDTCIECHNPHTLEVQVQACVECHGEGEPREFRMLASAVDYDGDGDIQEGIAFEIQGLQEILGAELVAKGLIYDASSYPYFFDDAGERFASWTPRLLKAAYNYQLSQKDPGGFAHGSKYIIQLLYDSIEDLNVEAVASLSRDDHGHFLGSADAFRHWDPGTRENGVVSGGCARCHSADGLPLYFEEGVNISTIPANGFQCETCHGGGEWPARYAFSSVTFPSGKTIAPAEGDESVLCMQCHQGRESGADLDASITKGRIEAAKAFEEAVATAKDAGETAPLETEPDDTVLPGQRFLNIHYFAAGATRYGSEAGGGYEYAGKEYVGVFLHVEGFDTCIACHDAHELEVKTDQCFTCHAGVEDVKDIRKPATADDPIDYDGDGDLEEGVYDEIATMKEVLSDAIVAYSVNTEGVNEVTYLAGYPYWSAANEGEELLWTPTLHRAAYNYQYASKDPGGFAHNGAYVLQLLYDSIEAIGGDVSAMTRP
jgi:hypothetical protein